LIDTATGAGASGSTLTSLVSELVRRVPNVERPDDIVVLAIRRTV
jgi:hypothetical protein